jgi:hypothetical protein
MMSVQNVKQEEQVTIDHADAVENNYCDGLVHTPVSTLKNSDPCTLTSLFESSKIKSFLYKVEPNIAKINASSLDLISTTAAIMLKALVEKAVLQERAGFSNNMIAKTGEGGYGQDRENRNRDASLNVGAEHFLLTSNHLKRLVSANNSSSLAFLEETFENFRDKDGSILPSKLHEYVPRKVYNKDHRVTKRSAATIAGNVRKAALNSMLYEEVKNGDTKKDNKRLKLLPSLNGGDDVNSLERVIAAVANAEEHYVCDKIVEDDDDYD